MAHPTGPFRCNVHLQQKTVKQHANTIPAQGHGDEAQSWLQGSGEGNWVDVLLAAQWLDELTA